MLHLLGSNTGFKGIIVYKLKFINDGKCGGTGPVINQITTIAGGTVYAKGISPIPNPDDFIASYSNYGAGVDLSAPNIRSTWIGGGYQTISGTSILWK